MKRLPAWSWALLSGVLLALAYPTFNRAELAFAALVPILWALAEPRRSIGAAFRLAWLFGFAFFLILLQWIPRLPPENATVPFLLYPALVLAAAYSALYVGAWGGLTAILSRGRPLSLVLVAPGPWVLMEIFRCTTVLGFPWGVLGGSQWAAIDWIQVASLGGVHLLSFLIVMVNASLAAALLDRGPRRLLWLATGFVLIVAPLHGRGERARLDALLPTMPTVSVALIQPNTGYDKWDAGRRAEIITGLVQASLDAARATNDSTLLIWPETATPTLLRFDAPNLGLVESVGLNTGRALFTGFPDREAEGPAGTPGALRFRYYNSAGLFLPGEGLVEHSPKMRLVPFAEWMPIPGLNRVNFGQSNFTPAESIHVFRQWRQPFGALVCIESIFPAQGRALVKAGARFLVNVTNDQWFGDSGAPWQHLSLAVFRSVETRAGMARAANTGVSCIIDPVGRIRHATPLFQPALVAGEVVLAPDRPTFYVRHGDWILPVGLGLAAIGALLAHGSGVTERTIRLDLAYDGTDFFGWQIQPDVRTVQGELVRALTRIIGEPVQVIGAGRTDTGVHATGQVASVRLATSIPTAGLARALNSLLPPDIHVARVTDVPDDFHARFSAIRRIYRYRVLSRPGPFRRRYAWVRHRLPGAAELNAAMTPWLGVHSFHALTQGEGSRGNTTCRIDRAEWRAVGNRLVLVLAADRFLYRMVRLMVAVLVDAHRRGCLTPEAMARLVTADAVRPPVAPAPARGLFLAGVDYARITGVE